MVGLLITCPPNGATPPHYHGGAAAAATLIQGRMLNQMVCPEHDSESQGSGPRIYGTGESWYEPPGCHHVRSENPSDTEAAQFIAVLVADDERIERLGFIDALVQIDAAEEEKAVAVSQ
jgi:quercetin dioxygenase-like cupin family protein